MTRLAIALAAIALATPALAASDHVDTALIFVIDCSASMDEEEVKLVRDAHRLALLSDDVQEAIRMTSTRSVAMAYVEFSAGQAWVVAGWTDVHDLPSTEAFVTTLYSGAACGHIASGNTPIEAGLLQALGLATSIPYDYDQLVVDVVGDGKDNSGAYLDGKRDYLPSDQLAVVRGALLSIGAIINGLPKVLNTIDNDLVPWYCGDPATGQPPAIRGGEGSFCRTLDRIEDLPVELRQKIVQELY